MRQVRHTFMVIVTIAVAAVTLHAQSSRALEAELRNAQYQEQIQGDVTGAIATYKKLAQRPEPQIAAPALLSLAQAYERLGRPEASETFARIVSTFGTSAEATTARRKLVTLEQRVSGSSQKALITGPDANWIFGEVSPDGRYLPFSHQTGHLALRDLNNNKVTLVTEEKNGGNGLVEYSVWSPDGRQLAYTWWPDTAGPGLMELRVISRERGTPRVLFTNKDGWMQAFDWSPDGRSLLATVDGGTEMYLGLISVADGSVRRIKTQHTAHSMALFAPDGKHVIYDYSVKGVPMREINIVGVDGSGERALVSSPDDDFLLGWSPAGQVLFGSDRLGTPGAWAIGVSDGGPQGNPFLVKADIGRTAGLGFDRKGRFFSQLSVAGANVFLAEVDPVSGKMTAPARPAPTSQPLARRGQGTWSPNGKQLAYFQTMEGRGSSLVIQDAATGGVTTRPLEVSNLERPSWFPDGSAVAIEANGPGGRTVYKVDLKTGSVTSLARVGNFWGVSPDGQWLLFGRPENRQPILWRHRLADGTEHKIRVQGGVAAAWSPDGTLIAQLVRPRTEGKPGPERLIVFPAAGGDERVVLDTIPAFQNELAWSHDGKHIFYIQNRNQLWRVPASGGEGVDTGIRVPLPKHLSVNADGKRIAISGGAAQAEVWVWENLLKK